MNTTISFRVKESDKKKLDRIAAAQERDRSFIIKEAIDHYFDAYQEKKDRIKIAQKEIVTGNTYNEKIWRTKFKEYRCK